MTDNPITLFHNNRCSKSRGALSLLEEQGLQPAIVNYLETPPSADEIARLLEMLALSPRELMRTGEVAYSEHRLDNPALTDEQLIAAMVEHPILIERPIVVANGKAAIGRPPERVLDIL